MPIAEEILKCKIYFMYISHIFIQTTIYNQIIKYYLFNKKGSMKLTTPWTELENEYYKAIKYWAQKNIS